MGARRATVLARFSCCYWIVSPPWRGEELELLTGRPTGSDQKIHPSHTNAYTNMHERIGAFSNRERERESWCACVRQSTLPARWNAFRKKTGCRAFAFCDDIKAFIK